MFLSIALRSALLASADIGHLGDDCQVTPVIHVLQYPGCVPKPIPSFACVGRCASYIQVGIESQSINQFNHNPLILSPGLPGVGQQDLANGAFLYVLPGVGRA